MSNATAVVLDKDQGERDDIRARLSRCGVLPICFQDEWMCLENIVHIKPAFAVLRTDSYARAYRFGTLANAIQRIFPVIVLSNKRGVERFIRNNWLVNLFFLRYPADDKGFQGAIALLSAKKEAPGRPVLIAGSTERKKLIQHLPLLGLSREPVLIEGRRGVGKRLMAKAIHGCSAHKDRLLDFVDAGQISGQWIRKARARMDTVDPERANGRVSAIENIENLPIAQQAQLLLLIERFHTSGAGERKNRLAVPLITLTGCNLAALVQKGVFRKDLYHRLSVLRVSVPQLAGHPQDICAMADYFAARYSIRHNGGICRLPDEVMNLLVDYHWPGNVPELKQVVGQLVSTDKDTWTQLLTVRVNARDIRSEKRKDRAYFDTREIHAFWDSHPGLSLKQVKTRYIIRVEKKMIKAALARTNGNCKKAAGLLEISYKSMLNKVKAYQLVGWLVGWLVSAHP